MKREIIMRIPAPRISSVAVGGLGRRGGSRASAPLLCSIWLQPWSRLNSCLWGESFLPAGKRLLWISQLTKSWKGLRETMARCTFREILTSYTNQRMAQLAGSAGFFFLPECAHPQSPCCPLWDRIKRVPAASVKQSRRTLGRVQLRPLCPQCVLCRYS